MADELKTRLEELERTAIENSAEVKRYREELKTLERKQKKLREEQQDLTLEADRK